MLDADIIAKNLEQVRNHIDEACSKSGRSLDDVTLIAVSKTWPASAVEAAYAAGQRVFGENKLQEAEEKVPQLPADCDWHFIGHAQRNKVRKILSVCSTVHAVDSIKLASAMSRIAGEEGRDAQVFLQLNVGSEESKFGFAMDELRSGFLEILDLPYLRIRGLMAIPPAVPDQEQARPFFQTLREQRDRLSDEFSVELPHLSMGMSGDYKVAIEEGATLVRVGSSIFGARNYA